MEHTGNAIKIGLFCYQHWGGFRKPGTFNRMRRLVQELQGAPGITTKTLNVSHGTSKMAAHNGSDLLYSLMFLHLCTIIYVYYIYINNNLHMQHPKKHTHTHQKTHQSFLLPLPAAAITRGRPWGAVTAEEEKVWNQFTPKQPIMWVGWRFLR